MIQLYPWAPVPPLWQFERTRVERPRLRPRGEPTLTVVRLAGRRRRASSEPDGWAYKPGVGWVES